MAAPGIFLSFEGIDGCGKTTQLQGMASRLRKAGCEPVIAQEPGGTRLGREIRALLLDSANAELRPIPELLLYFASRAQNIAEVIEPALEAGRVVLCDRFTDATAAYQGYGRGLGLEAVRRVEEVACRGVEPDLTLWLDIDPEVGVVRARRRNGACSADENRMEQEGIEFYAKVRQGYAAIHQAEPRRVRRIDAAGSVEDVARRIDAAASSLLALRHLARA